MRVPRDNSKFLATVSKTLTELTAEDLLIESEQKEGFFALTDKGITVAIDTTLTDELISEGITPIKRMGQPSDVAKCVSAVADGNFDFCTGTVIDCDGGFNVRRL